MRKAVCSWSLQPNGMQDLLEKVHETEVTAVQLALDPVRKSATVAADLEALQQSGLTIVSGMMEMAGEDYSTFETIRETGGVRPDHTWEENRQNARGNAALAQQLGLQLVTFHAGFIPHDPTDPERSQMMDRLREVADIFAEQGCQVALETGQESAETLSEVLQEMNHPGIGVNFDPANMILYGMGEPVASLDLLSPWVRQIHIKDAHPSTVAGEWGAEVPVGTGSVDWQQFFSVVKTRQLEVDLVIEREAGDDRIGDVKIASSNLDRWLGSGKATQ
jgi:L-ribulose-5-phosphate 3-epimerase